MAESDDNRVGELVVEVRAMREQLIRMDERMNMVQDHETRIRNIESFQVADHNGRLVALEKWKYALPASLFLGLASTATVLFNLLGKG